MPLNRSRRAPARIQRTPLVHNRRPNERLRPKHKAWIKTLPCVVCGNQPCDPAHVRTGADGGMGLTPSDRFLLPLCRTHHDEQHRVGETTFWSSLGIDPMDIAARLWAVTGDTDQGVRAVLRARQAIALHQRGS